MSAKKDPDQKLVARARHGNSLAFGELVEKYQDQILNLAYDFTGDFETAKDVAQNVFLKLFLHLSSFTGRSRFSTWLYRITINACLDQTRQTKKNVLSLFSAKKEAADIPDQNSEPDDQGNTIDPQLAKLSEQQRTAVLLRYYHEKKIEEIAEIMECSANTVRTHLNRSIEKIRKSVKTNK